MSTPPHSTTHPPPSLPTSPLAKRPKTEQATSMASQTEGQSSPVSNGTKPPPSQSQAPPPPLSSSSSPPLYVKKLSPKAHTPTRGSAFAAGYDLYSAMNGSIPARGKGLVDTDLAIAVGEGCLMNNRWPHCAPVWIGC
ncbi:hypothetical protein N7G274_000377 [Stereocaulon virgatum]|uniref:dUTP diphosphatase n=1 Tax=Stereocaulon virgatum TaxID=373712 RepID=A0ABR4AT89_9LECA